jgi:hypothetical protein
MKYAKGMTLLELMVLSGARGDRNQVGIMSVCNEIR